MTHPEHRVFVISAPHNGEEMIDQFTSDKPITLERLVAYYETAADFNWDRDSITIAQIEEPVDLDKWEAESGEQ